MSVRPDNKNMTARWALLCLALWAGAAQADAAVPRASDHVPGEVLVKFAATGSGLRAHKALSGKWRGAGSKRLTRIGVERWRLPPGTSVAAAMQDIARDPGVEFVEPNYRRYPRRIPNDPLYATRQSALPLMGLESAWDSTIGSRTVVIAVIDDGFDLLHADLRNNFWINPGEVAGNGIDDDQNGYVDDVNGWDFRHHDADPGLDAVDEHHGTYVSGALGAEGDNGVGIAGAAWSVSIMPLKFNFDVASELAAMEYALANGANIVNASWGGPQFSQAESGGVALLEQAGILLVTAAGNAGADNDRVPDYPSGLPNANVISVAASDSQDRLSAWTHVGAASVDLAAPGVNVYVAVPTGSAPLGNDYAAHSGTSFSAPFVAGIAALIKSATGGDMHEIKGRLLASVDPLNSSLGLTATDGRVNAARALTVTPRPVPVFAGVTVDADDNGNGVLEPEEHATLNVAIENVWLDAASVQAVLSSTDSGVAVTRSQADVGALAAGGRAVADFDVTVAEFRDHRRLRFRLDIEADGHRFARYFSLEVAALKRDEIRRGTLQQDDQDDLHVWTFRVPSGIAEARFALDAGSDVDLVVRRGGPPLFDPGCYRDGCVSSDTLLATDGGSAEEMTLTAPEPGVYFVAVFNASGARDVPYTIAADKTRVGGGGSALWLLPGVLLWWRRVRAGLLVAAALTAGCSMQASSSASTETHEATLGDHVQGELLVTFADGVDRSVARSVLAGEGMTIVREYGHAPLFHVRVPEGVTFDDARGRLMGHQAIVAVEPNWRRQPR